MLRTFKDEMDEDWKDHADKKCPICLGSGIDIFSSNLGPCHCTRVNRED